MKLVASILVVTACSALLPLPTLRAQDKPLIARQFLMDEYRTVIHADFKLLRDTGIWDEMNGTALKAVVALIEKEMTFSLEKLDRVTSVQAPLAEEGVEPELQRSVQQVTTVEGNGDLGDPDSDEDSRYQIEEIGAHRLLLDQWGSDSVVQVSPQLRVYGNTVLLRKVLSGKPRAGLPSADVLSFTAGKKNLLAYVVADVKNHAQPREALGRILPDAAWPEDDQPTHMCIRLLATGDEDDPHMVLEWAVRHGKDGAGLVATEKAVAAALQRLRDLKESRLFRPLLKKIDHERDGTDAVWRVDLGRARQAMGMLGTLAPFMFFSSVESQVVVRQQVLVAPESGAEAAPKPKKEAGPDKVKGEKKDVPVTTGGGN